MWIYIYIYIYLCVYVCVCLVCRDYSEYDVLWDQKVSEFLIKDEATNDWLTSQSF